MRDVRKVLILGAAGRDFHNFNVAFRERPDVRVVAFTATQIPDIAGRLRALPDWYTRDLESGGVVEERVTGMQFTSPSAQIDIVPGGNVVVLSTHDQVLGGPDNQVYMGCRFPADPAYAADLARHATAVGRLLAERGVTGRVAVDFAATRDWSGRWSLYALEVNLRAPLRFGCHRAVPGGRRHV